LEIAIATAKTNSSDF